MIYVGVMGHGTVGSGVVEVLQKNADSIAGRAGEDIVVKRILDLRDFQDLPYSELFTKNADDIFNDEEISIVVEVMGGITPAYTYTKRALSCGKHVVTSNKELVAQHGAELLKLAGDNNVNYLYEASVGGGIPIIRPLKQCLAGNDIYMISGILNGTTNYILTEMKNRGKDFQEALSDAQDKGYAERDPSADIEGHDAQRKIAILATIAFGKQVYYSDIPTEGITKISREDMIYAKELGYVIRLTANAYKAEDGIRARVAPCMIKIGEPLSDVEDVFNAILVKGDAIGDVMFYGRGAGKLPTASAVVGDIIDAAKHRDGVKYSSVTGEKTAKLLSFDDVESSFFIRVKAEADVIGKDKVNELFPGSVIVSLDKPELCNEFAIVTTPVKEGLLKQKLLELKETDGIEDIINTIRMDDSSSVDFK